MANFKYKAMSANGARIEGKYVAEDERAVVDMIRANNYYPLAIKEVGQGIKIELKRSVPVKTKDIAIFCRQFYTMLDAGATISSCVNILKTQLTNRTLRETLDKVDEDIRKGEALSNAMKKYPKVFPDLLVSMVETGELTGNLDIIMLRMSSHYEKENKINNKVKNAMVYPIVLAIVTVSVITFILTFVMPTFVSMFDGSGSELPTSTKIVLGLSAGLKSYFLLIILLIVASAFMLKVYFASEKGKYFASKMKLKLPIIRRLTQKAIVSRFTRTLSTVLSSGVSLVKAVEIVAGVVGNRVAEEKLLKIREQLIKGEGLSEPLKEAEIFPIMLSSMVKIGEESGSLDEILNKTADFYDEELETELQTFTSLIEPMMMVVMGVIIGFLIMSIVQPMFSMYNNM